jgi:hypothetical protein
MKPPELEPLDPEVAALFASARSAPPEGAKERVRARLRSSLGSGTAATVGLGAAAKSAMAIVGSKTSLLVAMAAVTLAAGAGLWVGPRPERPLRRTLATHQLPAPPPPASADDIGALAEEQRLLERARQALTGGRLAAGIVALGQHEKAFPRGLLREERETLWIVTLAKSGRMAAARARAVRFRQSYPNSIQTNTIERTLGAPPQHRGRAELSTKNRPMPSR